MKKLIFLILSLLISINIYAKSISELTEEQMNSVNMLNYLTVLMTEINNSKENKVFLDEVYSSLHENTNPKVDKETQEMLSSLLDSIENYRNANIQRDRIQFMYDRNQSNLLKNAIPNPIGLLSAVRSGSKLQAVASIAYMATDAIVNYNSAKNDAELEFIKKNWEVEDAFNETLHEIRKSMFGYLIEISNAYDIDKEYSLTEGRANEYIKWKNDSNLPRKIKWFENNINEYIGYANYYLDLATFYYENKEYQKCIDAIYSYKKMHVGIFREDYNYAKTLTYGVLSLFELIENNRRVLANSSLSNDIIAERNISQFLDEKIVEYENTIIIFLQEILDNMKKDWVLRYFVINAYVELGKNKSYSWCLMNAYDEVRKNIVELHNRQSELNNEYLAPVKKNEIPQDATKEKRKSIESSNKQLEEMRKKDMVPILYALAYHLDIYNELKEKFPDAPNCDDVISSDSWLFFYVPYNNLYLKTDYPQMFDIDLTKSREVCVPLIYVQEQSSITAKVIKKTTGEVILIDDFKIDFVDRNGEKIDTFKVYYKSEELSKMKIREKDSIEIDVFITQDANRQDNQTDENVPIKYQFKPTFKRIWYTAFIGKGVSGYEKI